MRNFTVDIPLIGASGEIVTTQKLDAFDDGKKVKLTFGTGPLVGQEYEGVDYFWVMADARVQLEQLGFMPACKGALKYVFPGGLQGETSLGLLAYVFNYNGDVTGRTHIFDVATPEEFSDIVSFDDQKAFRKSISGKRGRHSGV